MDNDLRKNALRKLAATDSDAAQVALDKEATKVSRSLRDETNYDVLKIQLETLEIFAYRVPQEALGIVVGFLDRLPSLELTHSESYSGFEESISKYQSKESLSVKSLSVLSRIRYHAPEAITKLFLQYSTHDDKEISREAYEGLTNLAGYNIDVFYGVEGRAGIGTYPQEKIIETLHSLDSDSRQQFLHGIKALCTAILSPTLEGTASDYKTVTWRTAAIPGIEAVQKVRRDALEFLSSLFPLAESIADKISLINALHEATRTPHVSDYSDATFRMIVRDSAWVLNQYSLLVESADLPVVQKIEHDAFWLNQNRNDEEIRREASRVKEKIDSNAEYQIYKVLIGFEGVFSDWRSPDISEADTPVDHRREIDHEEQYRNDKVSEFARSITEENLEEWSERIVRYAAIDSQDLATFPYFGKFLEQFAATSPHLGLQVLRENASYLERFFTPIFLGLWVSDAKPEARDLMQELIQQDMYLYACARVFEFNDEPHDPIVEDIFDRAVKCDDRQAIIRLMAAAVAKFGPSTESLVGTLFIPALNYLTLHSDASWVFDFWYRREMRDLMSCLTTDDQDVVLANLIVLEKIDYHAEEIILPIAESRPDSVVEFFGKRLSFKKGLDSEHRFEPIPYEFHKLSEPLSKIPKKAIQIVFSQYDGNYGLFAFRGGLLLKNIFHSFPEDFERELINIVKQGGDEAIHFVMAILRNYDGNIAIYETCKEIVKTLPIDSDLLNEVEIILESTGVVSGEFGLAQAYEHKIIEIEPWMQDPDDRVRSFAARYTSNLTRFAESERQRATEEIEIRKHKYGSDDE